MNTQHNFDKDLDACLREDRMPFQKTKAEAWEAVNARIDTAPIRRLTPSPLVRVARYAAAAAVVLAVVSASAFFLGSSEVRTLDKTSEVVLPDGSSVALNKNTTIAYNTFTWNFSRSVKLESGEAFFDVSEGEKFTVSAPKGTVEVLGTSFNVSVSQKQFYVGCKTGKVRVASDDKESEVILTPGKQANLSGDKFAVSTTNPSFIDAWTKGDFSFEDIAISEVFKTLEKNTDYTITYDDKNFIKYSGAFNINQPITDVMDIICLPAGLEYRIAEKENLIVVSKK